MFMQAGLVNRRRQSQGDYTEEEHDKEDHNGLLNPLE